MDTKDFAIILALLENPIASNSEIKDIILSTQGIDISEITVARRIKKLEEDNILAGASAEINYSKLDLTLYAYIILLAPKIMHNSLILRSLLSEHPYILYQNRLFGAFNGLFCQFAIPNSGDAIEHHREFLSELRQSGIILDFFEFKAISKSEIFATKLQYFNLEALSWATPTNYLEEYEEGQQSYKAGNLDNSILDQTDILDIILLRELAMDCRRSNQMIIDYLEDKDNVYNKYAPEILMDLPMSKQTISRRIISLRDNGFHQRYTLWYNREMFGMFNQTLFTFERNDIEVNNLVNFIREKIPFPGSLLITDTDVLLWLDIPIIEVMKLSELISSRFDQLKVSLLHRKPVTYPLWPANYDAKERNWKTSKDYIQGALGMLDKLKQMSLEELMVEAEKWVDTEL